MPTKDTRLFVSGEIKDAIEASSWRWKALDVAVKVALPILLALCGWLGAEVLDLSKRVEVIEATRYTAADAAKRDEALAEIKVLLAEQGATTKDVLRRLGRIEARLDSR